MEPLGTGILFQLRVCEVTYFIKKIHICDEEAMQPDGLIAYGSLVQEAMSEYHNIFTSKW